MRLDRLWLAAGALLALVAALALAAPRVLSSGPILAADAFRLAALAAAAIACGQLSRSAHRFAPRNGMRHAELLLFVAFLCTVGIFHSASTLAGMPATHPLGERWWMNIPRMMPIVAAAIVAAQFFLVRHVRRRGS